jgi:hypothetical protein
MSSEPQKEIEANISSSLNGDPSNSSISEENKLDSVLQNVPSRAEVQGKDLTY